MHDTLFRDVLIGIGGEQFTLIPRAGTRLIAAVETARKPAASAVGS